MKYREGDILRSEEWEIKIIKPIQTNTYMMCIVKCPEGTYNSNQVITSSISENYKFTVFRKEYNHLLTSIFK